MINQNNYMKALNFAMTAHADQKMIDGVTPYFVHCNCVANEVMLAAIKAGPRSLVDWDAAVQVALLHDVIEDTTVTYEDIEKEFGKNIAIAVLSLTKNTSMQKEWQIKESVERILKAGEVAAIVKVADRIVNTYEVPISWPEQKAENYFEDSKYIAMKLGHADPTLCSKLASNIGKYKSKIKNREGALTHGF